MNGIQPTGRVTALATLWFAALAVAATAPALLGGRSLGPEFMLDADPLYARGEPPQGPPVYDATRFFYDVPRDLAAADGIRHGRVDFWNPRVGMGMPLWGEGGGLFFPAKIPFYLAPSRRTYDLASALRLVIAGLGAFLLARRRGLAPLPAVAAGSLFELSGSIMATLQFGLGAPVSLLPWVLLGAELIAQRRRPGAAAAAGLALGATAISGHPMLVVAVFAGFGAAVAGHMLVAWRQPRAALAIGVLATLAVAIGLGLAAPAVLPVLEAQSAGRQYKNTAGYNMQLNWYRAHTRAALPIALLAPATLVELREDLSPGFPYSLVAPAVGLLALVFAVGGVLRRGLDAPLAAVALLGLGLTLAPPLLAYVRRIPLLYYVYPMYAWSLVALPLTQAAGRGVALLSMPRQRLPILVALGVVLAGTSSLWLVRDVSPGTFLAFAVRQVLLTSIADWSGWLRLVLPLSLLPLVVVALVLAAGTRFGDRCIIAATVLASLELIVCVAPTTWFPDSAILGTTPSPAVRFLQQGLQGGQQRMIGSPRTLGYPATPSIFGLADLRGAAALPVERYVRYLEAITPNPAWYVWQFPLDVTRHPLLDLAAVRYVVRPVDPAHEPEPLLEGDGQMRLAYRDQRVAIYENAAALPRARIVHAAVAVRDRDDAFRRLVQAAAASPHAAGAALAEHVLVEPGADGDPAPQSPAVPAQDAEAVQILPGDDPDRVELQATLALPGWVVLADTFYPGWTATINGARAPIHPTDLLFRGVFVSPGSHRIVFRYQPRSIRLGLALSAVSLAVCMWLLRGAARAPAGARRPADAASPSP